MIMVTGFEAFGVFPKNSSEDVIHALHQESAKLIQLPIETCLLPVEHKRCFEVLLPYLKKREYTHIFLLGMAVHTLRIAVEKVALNWIYYNIPDNAYHQPQDEWIEQDGPDAYFSNFPVITLSRLCEQTKIPVQISLNAGSFICNELYFRTLHWIYTTGYPAKTVFLHLPAILSWEKTDDELSRPGFTFEEIYHDVITILKEGTTL